MENEELSKISLISKEDKQKEIMIRLQSDEAKKARMLLATAMTHLEAHKIVKSSIMEKLGLTQPKHNGKHNGSK